MARGATCQVGGLQTGFVAAIDAAIERRVDGLHDEFAQLQRRVNELEGARGTDSDYGMQAPCYGDRRASQMASWWMTINVHK